MTGVELTTAWRSAIPARDINGWTLPGAAVLPLVLKVLGVPISEYAPPTLYCHIPSVGPLPDLLILYGKILDNETILPTLGVRVK